MNPISYVLPYTSTISLTCTIFNRKWHLFNLNNIGKFQNILRTFTRSRAFTNRETIRMRKYFSPVLESVKSEH